MRKLSDRFFETSMNDGIVLMDARSGAFHALKGVAREIWRLMDGCPDEGALVAALCSRFDVAPDVCRRDVEAFISRLAEVGFVARS